MEYKEIVSVTGEPGLFQLLSSKSDGAIVRSLDGQTTRFVPSRNHNFTPLESIEVFTTGENVPLSEIFQAMQSLETSVPVPESKDNEAVRQYFEQVYPSLDRERVYMSDMKKMLKWYPLLKAKDLLKFEEEKEEEEAATEATDPTVTEEKEKPAPAKKAAKVKTKTGAASEKPAAEKEKPAKKPAAGKKKAATAKKPASKKA